MEDPGPVGTQAGKKVVAVVGGGLVRIENGSELLTLYVKLSVSTRQESAETSSELHTELHTVCRSDCV